MSFIYELLGLRIADSDSKTSDDTKRVTRTIRLVLFISILFLIIFSAFYSIEKLGYILGILLIIAGAAYIFGYLLGFLFGIPRSVKFNKPNSSGDDPKEEKRLFDDNTNLEEISDWLTKIIIGLTLVEFREIQRLLDIAAINISGVFSEWRYIPVIKNISGSFPEMPLFPSMVVFSYALLIFYLGLGFFAGYFWTRTQFVLILIDGRIEERNKIQKQVVAANSGQSSATENLDRYLNRSVATANQGQSTTTENKSELLFGESSLNDLKKKVAAVLVDTPVIHDDDTQKGRWGGLASLNNRALRASVLPSAKYSGYFDVTIEVASTSSDSPLIQTVIVLLDKTYPEPEIYLIPINNKATVTVVAYEAFTVAALCDNLGTRLELDLQLQKGFPSSFYYKN
ncbi:hypothetical protein GCM10028808_47010 [Spirosoma migulaei]